jgi:hypothetical protein
MLRDFKPNIRLLGLACALSTCLLTAASVSAAASTTKGVWSFFSAPNLHPPKLHTDAPTQGRKLAPGLFMVAIFKNSTLANQQIVGQGGPLILDSHLQPVWFHPLANQQQSSTNLTTQTYKGKPVLTWWQGDISNTGATTSGEVLIVDQNYRIVRSLTAQQGWIISPHEFLINGNEGWVTAYQVVPMDLTTFGGSAHGFLLDSAVQKYDLKTGKLLSTWDAKDHIPLSQSETHPAPIATIPWDAYHVNSIQLRGNGSGFITSMRNTWAAYSVDVKTNNILWTLGGKASSFTVPAGAAFEWQHDVALHAGNLVSIFDDACCAIAGAGVFGAPSGPSRGLVLRLDSAHHSATLVAQYTHGGIDAQFLGSTRLLPNGNVVVGWGSQAFFSEYSKSGKLLLDAVFPTPDISYRTLVAQWVGKPLTPPAGAARNQRGKVTVYASWNGATQVVKWRVLAGPGSRHLAGVAVKNKAGFETAISLKRGYKAFRVQALDARGRVLGTSKTFSAQKPSAGVPGVCFYPPCPA